MILEPRRRSHAGEPRVPAVREPHLLGIVRQIRQHILGEHLRRRALQEARSFCARAALISIRMSRGQVTHERSQAQGRTPESGNDENHCQTYPESSENRLVEGSRAIQKTEHHHSDTGDENRLSHWENLEIVAPRTNTNTGTEG